MQSLLPKDTLLRTYLVTDLFLFCFERDLMMFLSDDKQADIIDAFNTTSRYLDDILNINNVYQSGTGRKTFQQIWMEIPSNLTVSQL